MSTMLGKLNEGFIKKYGNVLNEETFKNDNGTEYEVIERSRTGKNALMKSPGGNFIIGYDTPKEKGSWAQGHYYMNDEKAARRDWEKKYVKEDVEKQYKLQFYATDGANKGNRTTEETFDTIEDMRKRYAEVFKRELGAYNPTAWVKRNDGWKRIVGFSTQKNDSEYVNESLKKSLKNIYTNLLEAEMSDADKHDSELIRSIYNKIQKRANAKLTPEEQAVLDKYNLIRTDSKGIYTKNERGWANNPVATDHSFRKSTNVVDRRTGIKPEVNLADRARKVDSRRPYTDSVMAQNTSYSPDTTANHDTKYTPRTFQDMERVKQNNDSYENVHNMKDALRDRKYHQKEYDKIDTEYQKKLAQIEKQRKFDTQYHSNALDRANDTIDTLLKKK